MEHHIQPSVRDNSNYSRPITFEDLGIPVIQQTRQTYIGKVRTFQSLYWEEWIFLSCSILAIVVSTALAIQKFVKLPAESDDHVLAILFLINAGFTLIYAINGIFREQLFELLAYIAALIIFLVYVILNFVENTNASLRDEKLVRLIFTVMVVCLLAPLGSYLTYKYYISGALLMRSVGALEKTQVAARKVFTTQSLLKLDAQMTINTVVLILNTGMNRIDLLEILVLTFGSIETVIWWIIGYYAIRKENKLLAYIFYLISPVAPVYIICKFVMIPGPSGSVLTKCSYAAGSVALLIRCLLVLFVILCVKNFGKGLKEVLFPPSTSQQRQQSQASQSQQSVASQSPFLSPPLTTPLLLAHDAQTQIEQPTVPLLRTLAAKSYETFKKQ